MAFHEIRQYSIKPGKMADWVKLFDEEIMPFQVSKGVVVAGSFRGEEDDSVFIWMRRFESEEQRVSLYAAVYEDPHWKEKIAPRVAELMDRSKINSQRVVATTSSVVR